MLRGLFNFIGLYRARRLDRTSEKEQLLGQCSFPGIRVADNRKRAALLNFL